MIVPLHGPCQNIFHPVHFSSTGNLFRVRPLPLSNSPPNPLGSDLLLGEAVVDPLSGFVRGL